METTEVEMSLVRQRKKPDISLHLLTDSKNTFSNSTAIPAQVSIRKYCRLETRLTSKCVPQIKISNKKAPAAATTQSCKTRLHDPRDRDENEETKTNIILRFALAGKVTRNNCQLDHDRHRNGVPPTPLSPNDEDGEEPAVPALRVAHGPVVEHHVRDGAHEKPDHEVVEHAQHFPSGTRLRRALLLLHRPGMGVGRQQGKKPERGRFGCGLLYDERGRSAETVAGNIGRDFKSSCGSFPFVYKTCAADEMEGYHRGTYPRNSVRYWCT